MNEAKNGPMVDHAWNGDPIVMRGGIPCVALPNSPHGSWRTSKRWRVHNNFRAYAQNIQNSIYWLAAPGRDHGYGSPRDEAAEMCLEAKLKRNVFNVILSI
jgi:hypothetical protein